VAKAWNSTLPARSKPLKQSPWRRKARVCDKGFKRKPKAIHKRTEIKKISKSLRAKKREYFKKHSAYLAEHPFCGICLVQGVIPPNPATEIHHKFGRAGSLLNDERGFVPSCRSCREIPHANPQWAREMGILGTAAQWNVPIDRHQ